MQLAINCFYIYLSVSNIQYNIGLQIICDALTNRGRREEERKLGVLKRNLDNAFYAIAFSASHFKKRKKSRLMDLKKMKRILEQCLLLILATIMSLCFLS